MAEEKTAEENATSEEEQATEEGGKKSNKLILIIVVVVLLLGSGGGAAYYMLGTTGDKAVATEGEDDEDDEDEEDTESEDGASAAKDAFYFSLDPAFVVNFQGKSRARYLQVNIDGMTRKEQVKLEVTKHQPQIRNNVVLLLSSQEYDVLIKPEGKDTLRKDILKEINKILENETGKEDSVEDIYFTNFVMQ